MNSNHLFIRCSVQRKPKTLYENETQKTRVEINSTAKWEEVVTDSQVEMSTGHGQRGPFKLPSSRRKREHFKGKEDFPGNISLGEILL